MRWAGRARGNRLAATLVLVVACRFDSAGLDSGGDGVVPGSGETTTSTGSGSGSTMPEDGATTTGPTTGSTGSTEASDPTTSQGAAGSSSGTGAACPDDWWDVAWTRRRELHVSAASIDATVEEAVVPITLAANILDFEAVQEDARDLRFVLDGSPLPYEVERWDPDGESLLWLSVGELPASGLDLHVYYGNPVAQGGSDGAATWPDSYVSVHHLDDFSDATGNGHDGLTVDPPTSADGPLARAAEFDGVDDLLEIAPDPAFDLTTDLTVEAWIRVSVFDTAWQAIVTKGDDAWRLSRNNQTAFIAFVSDPPNNSALAGVTPVDDGGWHHVAVTYSNATKQVWVDGMLDGEGANAGPIGVTAHAVQIAGNAQVTNRHFAGGIDEVRISKVARSPGYFALQAEAGTTGVATFFDATSCE